MFSWHKIIRKEYHELWGDKPFATERETHKDVFLWHIDGVIYEKTSKCDCAVITSDEMEFIEFKTNASNNSDEAIFDNYHKASDQLQKIVKDVKERCSKVGVKLTSVIPVEAHAVFNPTVPADIAMKKNISAKFLVRTGVKLRFDNMKVLK